MLLLVALGLIAGERALRKIDAVEVRRAADAARWPNAASQNEMLAMLFAARYLVLSMALFSIYAGFLYNDCFSLPAPLVASRWGRPDGTNGRALSFVVVVMLARADAARSVGGERWRRDGPHGVRSAVSRQRRRCVWRRLDLEGRRERGRVSQLAQEEDGHRARRRPHDGAVACVPVRLVADRARARRSASGSAGSTRSTPRGATTFGSSLCRRRCSLSRPLAISVRRFRRRRRRSSPSASAFLIVLKWIAPGSAPPLIAIIIGAVVCRLSDVLTWQRSDMFLAPGACCAPDDELFANQGAVQRSASLVVVVVVAS